MGNFYEKYYTPAWLNNIFNIELIMEEFER